jgi:Sigma-70, region 4
MAKLNDTGARYVNIPSFIFQDRSVAALEAVVVYLKETNGMTYAQIADLLNRDDRTIWTTYQRATKKREAAP